MDASPHWSTQGMTAATACATCGTEPRGGARFCDSCGSVIAPAGEQAGTAQRLPGMTARDRRISSSESVLVGREWESAALAAMLDRSVAGRGSVVRVVGPAGIGKTRLVRETVQLAESRGIEVFSTFCESHATDVPFRAVARLLRAVGQVGGLDDEAARAQVRTRIRGADPQDMLLLDDLLGIADPGWELAKIDPDARRRRLTALINTAQLTRTDPAVIVIEDVQSIDEVSESMLADFLTVIGHTHSLVLITYRPEYYGALAQVAGAQTIALAPLTDPETSTLVAELLGPDPSVGEIGTIIAGRAAGNPFFAQEIIRELAQRGVLAGERGSYACRTDVAEIRVPATPQATLAARIDRLRPAAKHAITAAAVIGSRFSSDLLTGLGIDASVEELIGAELIEQVRFTPYAEYAFAHPLVRTVAYDAQLKSDRADVHRKLAAAIESRDPESADQNAALIAGHLEAAGDGHAAYGWHMRAAAWAMNRDSGAARLSWQRAQKIADALPADDPGRAAMRIAPRTMLCGIAWRVEMTDSANQFAELQELCAAVGDKAPLAIAMAGLVIDHVYQDRMHEASQLASEAMALLESNGDPALTVGLAWALSYAKMESGEWADVQRWSQTAIDLADDDPAIGNFLLGSPLAAALAERAFVRWRLGRPGWRDDQQRALTMARSADPLSHAIVVAFVYQGAILLGARSSDDSAVRDIEDAVQNAERSGDDHTLSNARQTLGLALVHRHTAAERDRGRQLLAEVSEVIPDRRHKLGEFSISQVYVAREKARRGDRDAAVPLIRAVVNRLIHDGLLLGWGFPAICVLVETLLDWGTDAHVAEAGVLIELLATDVADEGTLAIREIWLLRLRALLARTRGDTTTYLQLRDRYRDMAKTLGFEGHIAWAKAMT